MTPHDGRITADHPRYPFALAEVQSATSLRRLPCDRLGWCGAMLVGWRSTVKEDQPLTSPRYSNGINRLPDMVIFAWLSLRPSIRITARDRGGYGQAAARDTEKLTRHCWARRAEAVEVGSRLPPSAQTSGSTRMTSAPVLSNSRAPREPTSRSSER